MTSLQDLDGKIWAAPAANSLAHNFYVQAMLAQAGVTPAEERYYDSDNAALLALVNGEADFATATFMPPLLPFEERPWQYGNDEPDLWRQLGQAPYRHPLGYIVVAGLPENGGYRVRDARAGLFDVQPAVFDQTRILTVTAPLPLDTVAVGPQFPLATARELNQALADFVASDRCQRSLCSSDFLNWSGLQPVDEAAYQPLRFMMETLDVPAGFWWTVLVDGY
jgi:ABC-type phosphate/phosphonate transport system substrate-binding protein